MKMDRKDSKWIEYHPLNKATKIYHFSFIESKKKHTNELIIIKSLETHKTFSFFFKAKILICCEMNIF